jgi:hypothetical protein
MDAHEYDVIVIGVYRFKTRRTVPTWYFMRSATLPGSSTR